MIIIIIIIIIMIIIIIIIMIMIIFFNKKKSFRFLIWASKPGEVHDPGWGSATHLKKSHPLLITKICLPTRFQWYKKFVIEEKF